MALSSLTNWEVRTTGSDANGGGFVSGASGTDFSQQDAAQFSGTDLVVSGTSATSASHSFSSADVGNIINATGYYQVVSVSGGAATLDRTGATNGTWALGGGLQTLATALGTLASGHTVWVKAGTYTFTSVVTLANFSSITVEGYQTAHGDLGTRPLVTTATNSTRLFSYGGISAGYYQFVNINFSNTAGTNADCVIASNGGGYNSLLFYLCKLTGFVAAVRGDFSGDYYFEFLCLINCEITSCTGSGAIWNDGGGTQLIGCYIHGNTSHGCYFDQGEPGVLFADNCVFAANGGSGIYVTATGAPVVSVTVKNSVFYDNTADGIHTNQPFVPVNIVGVNNDFDSNGGYGVNLGEAAGALGQSLFLNNAFRANTSGAYNNYPGGIGDITLTASPFTNVSTPDFSLNSTAGGGPLLKAAGFPGVTPMGSGNADVGALQSAGGGGGGGGLLFDPGMTGGIRG